MAEIDPSGLGLGKPWILLALLLLMSLIFAVTKIAPVYLDKAEFERELVERIRPGGSPNKSDREILESIQALARSRGFAVDEADVRIERLPRFQASPGIRVQLAFRRSVEFPGYVHTFTFEFVASSVAP